MQRECSIYYLQNLISFNPGFFAWVDMCLTRLANMKISDNRRFGNIQARHKSNSSDLVAEKGEKSTF